MNLYYSAACGPRTSKENIKRSRRRNWRRRRKREMGRGRRRGKKRRAVEEGIAGARETM